MKASQNLKQRLNTFAQRGNWQGKIVKLITTDLFCVLMVSGIVRLIYYSVLQNSTNPDSSSYLQFHANILLGEVDIFRTPVYPCFIKLMGLLSRQNLIDVVIAGQCLLSFLSIILFYKILGAFLQRRDVVLYGSLAYGMLLPVINLDKEIRTESLSISFVLLFLYLIIGYIKKPAVLSAVVITLFVFFLVMLRPSFIVLLPIIILFWLLRLACLKQQWKSILAGLITSGVVFLLIIGYSYLNSKRNHYNGISIVSVVNQFDIIINDNIYTYGNDAEITASIISELKKPQPLGAHWNLLFNIFSKYPPERLATFVNTCIKNKPKIYIANIYQTVARLKTDNIFPYYATFTNSALARVLSSMQISVFFLPFNLVFIALMVDLLLLVISWYRHKRVNWFKTLLWLMIAGQITVAIIGAQAEYQRLIAPIMPCLLMLLCAYIDRIYAAMDISKFKDYKSLI